MTAAALFFGRAFFFDLLTAFHTVHRIEPAERGGAGMDNRKTVRIRKGINGFPYSICTDDGRFIANAESIAQIREHYAFEIRHKYIRIVKETAKYPEDATAGERRQQ